jgi:hypothetical protein
MRTSCVGHKISDLISDQFAIRNPKFLCSLQLLTSDRLLLISGPLSFSLA